MNDNNGQIYKFILYSLILHLVIVILIYSHVDKNIFNAPKEQVIEVHLDGKKPKIADILPPKNEVKPDNTNFVGMYNSSVKEEVVAVSKDAAPGRPGSRGGVGAKQVKKHLKDYEAPKEAENKGDKGVKIYKEKKEKDIVSNEDALLEPKFGSMPEEFYPDFKIGQHTYINVMKMLDLQYFVRLKRVLRWTWNPRNIMRRLALNGFVKTGVVKVVIGMAITTNGELDELFIIRSSGINDYDNEAMRAFKASAPFSTPPKKLLNSDNKLRIAWTFAYY